MPSSSGLALEGSPYVAPEVASTDRRSPLKGDVYALGVMLAELLGVEVDGDTSVSREADLARHTGGMIHEVRDEQAAIAAGGDCQQ